MKTLTVGEIRNMLSYMPDEAECFIALSKDRIVSLELEDSDIRISTNPCQCNSEFCGFCSGYPSEQVFFRTE